MKRHPSPFECNDDVSLTKMSFLQMLVRLNLRIQSLYSRVTGIHKVYVLYVQYEEAFFLDTVYFFQLWILHRHWIIMWRPNFCKQLASLCSKVVFAPPAKPQLLIAIYEAGQICKKGTITINVPLFKKLRDIIFFGGENHFMSHFEGHFEGASTFLTPQFLKQRDINSYCTFWMVWIFVTLNYEDKCAKNECLSQIWLFFHPGSRIRTVSILDPESEMSPSRIPDPNCLRPGGSELSPSRIPDPHKRIKVSKL